MKKNKAIKEPVTNRTARVPFIMQMEELECGAAALAMVLAYYGKWVPLEQMRVDCGISRDGSNAKNIMIAARSHGLEAKGMRATIPYLKKKGTFPCIIFWNFNHFVVLNGFSGDKAVINDPARGLIRVSKEEFNSSFTGVCIFFKPTENFVPGGKRASVWSFAKKRMKGTGPAIVFVIITTIISSVLGIINPVVTRVFMDRLLPGKNPDWLFPVLFLMILLAIIEIISAVMESIYSLRINGKMSVLGTTSYMWKVLHLPMEFFSQRDAGEIQMRMDTNASIAETLVDKFIPLIINSCMMYFYLFVMLKNSVFLTLIGIGTLVFTTVFSSYIGIKKSNAARVQMRDTGKMVSFALSGIQTIESIKASGAEEGYFAKWAGYQASVNRQDVEVERISNIWGIIPGLLSEFAGYAVLIIGVYLCIQGKFTEGMIFAFQSFLSSFMSPALSLAATGQNLQEMRTNMERVEDVMEYPEDSLCTGRETTDDYSKLTGRIEIKNVTFGYSRLAAPLIENFSMDLKPGSRVAFVGTSGCGKSTLSKLISGLYQPWSGEILFDGKPIEEIDHNVFTGSLAVVDQDIILFEDTIADNIRMWDNSIEQFEVVLASRDASIYSDILKRPGGFQGKLTEDGRDLSGGQRQRLEIARVLAQDPTIIIMDEATSALDAKTEYDVVKAIKDRGITCIVVAHRLSTIRDCDEIIVLDHGKVVERGRHEELYAKGGYYTELVTSE
ncbi:MAG: NHLP family bacteriocin export ABC transporter peptidase/permease/ATPase subunit [Blautia sp.]|nr:NHLP family bacteriocin export ABC transporter peptidase/permease/ATPase subunit [Blautia sp.]